MRVDLLTRVLNAAQHKTLQAEHNRLKRLYADIAMQNAALRDARCSAYARIDRCSWKKVVRPSCRKEMAKTAVNEQGLSIRQACMAFMISERCYRYQPILSDENALICDWLITLTRMSTVYGGLAYALHICAM